MKLSRARGMKRIVAGTLRCCSSCRLWSSALPPSISSLILLFLKIKRLSRIGIALSCRRLRRPNTVMTLSLAGALRFVLHLIRQLCLHHHHYIAITYVANLMSSGSDGYFGAVL